MAASSSVKSPRPPSAADASQTPSFDRVARIYRLAEYLTLGPALARTRSTHLPHLVSSKRALILGDGDGRALAALLRLNPTLSTVVVDSSEAMLRLLRNRCRFAGNRLLTCHGDAMALLTDYAFSPPRFDLVTTHFFLDCFTEAELGRLIPAIAEQVEPGALWVVSEFRIPPARFIRLPARLLVRALYLAFRLLTGLRPTRLPDYAPLLAGAGFVRVRCQLRLGGMLTAELWKLPGEPLPKRVR